MASQGLGALFEGFRSGQEMAATSRRNRQIERAIDYELEDAANRRAGADRARKIEYGEDAPMVDTSFKLKDPFIVRLWDKFMGKGGRAPSQVPPQALPTDTPAAPMSPGVQTYALPQSYADGGKVGVSRIDRLNAEHRALMAKKSLRGRIGAAGKKVAPVALGATAYSTYKTDTDDYRDRFAIDRDVASLPPGAEVDETMEEKDAGLLGALTDSEFYGDIGVRALGAASDLGNVLSFGQADRLYRDKQEKPADTTAAVTALPVEEPPEDVAKKVAAQPVADSGGAATTAPAALPQPAPVEEDTFDHASVQAMPEDYPTMSTRDWVDYRRQMVDALMQGGLDAEAAHDKVTGMQQKGFLSNAKQASFFLQSGDPQSAARALKAAYQYFPNGSDVRFGITKDKAGQPALISMGRDEETGEPKGKPMLINEERLAAMVSNFVDPHKFTAWTKDWRDEAFKNAKYEEVDKRAAESDAIYRDRAGKAALVNAEADKIRASGAGAASGLKQSDYDRAYDRFMTSKELKAIDDPEKADDLADIMSRIYQANPGTPYPSIIKLIMAADRNGTLEEELEALGLK